MLSKLTDDERRFALAQALRVLAPGGVLIVADEVQPRSARQRLLHGLARGPLLAATFLISGKITKPVADLRGEVAAAGFAVEAEKRSHGGALAILVARRPAEEMAA